MALAVAIFIVSVVHLQMTTAGITQRAVVDTPPIVFPGPVELNNLKAKVEEPDECKGKTYCTIKPADYPDELFNKMFKDARIAQRWRRAINDSTQGPLENNANVLPQPSLVLDTLLTNRQGDPDLTDDCDSEVKYDPLYRVREKRDGDWREVVQAPTENFVQRVRLEICTNTEASCFNGLHLTSEIKTSCKQKYNKWEVLVRKGDKDTEKIEVELPVCCSCVYKTAPIQNRFGIDKKMSPVKPTVKTVKS